MTINVRRSIGNGIYKKVEIAEGNTTIDLGLLDKLEIATLITILKDAISELEYTP